MTDGGWVGEEGVGLARWGVCSQRDSSRAVGRKEYGVMRNREGRGGRLGGWGRG